MEKVAEGFKGEKAIVTPYNIRNLQRENNITKQLFVSHIGYYPHAVPLPVATESVRHDAHWH